MAYQSGKAIVECPFCHKVGVMAFHKPSYSEASTSRISNKSATTYRRVDEKYFIQGDCPKCGKSQKDIQKWYDGEYAKEKELSHKERLKRLKEAGLPTKIVSKR